MTTSVPRSSGGSSQQDPLFDWSPADSPARATPSPAGGGERRTRGGAGRGCSASFAHYDPGTSSWKTSQLSLPIERLSVGSSVTWQRAGMTRNGTAFRLPPLVPLIDVIGSSSLPTPTATPGGYNQSPSPGAAVRPSLESMARHGLWPTPRASDGERGGRGDLLAKVRTGKDSRRKNWPTPTAHDWKGAGYSGQLPNEVGTGQLNPTWVEWLMGFPLGWTDCGDSETPSSLRSPSTSDGSS